MRYIFLIITTLLLACNNKMDENKNKIYQDPIEIDAIKLVLEDQKTSWNNGDIEGFMKGYWNSDKLIFTSAQHKPTYGWKATLKRYKESYPNKASMGRLEFKILNISLESEKKAKLKGEWRLIRQPDNASGKFWLDLNKFDRNWLIVKDSTTSF